MHVCPPNSRLDAGGLVVGLLPQADYVEEPINLNSGDLLLAYTDGISEAMTMDDQEWGEEQMLKAVLGVKCIPRRSSARNSPRHRRIYRRGEHDDMTLLVMELN